MAIQSPGKIEPGKSSPVKQTAFAPSRLPGKKEALPAFIPPQLASEASAPPVGEHWVHE